jgi:lipopolysaccharide/colanic/teichoic acid biosynthesis glycosyltransferase
VLLSESRVGQHGRTFRMLRFRRMADGVHIVGRPAAPGTGRGAVATMTHPWVTRVVRVLRRYSLEDLPQLVNVLRGEMSLVGPRPALPDEVERYGIGMRRRFALKPGLSGLWQLSGRSDLSWDELIRRDNHYVEHWSLFLDLMIIWRTVRAVLRGEGAS